MIDELMVQQQVKSVWQHMVGVMCLNLTYRKQVKKLLPKLFKRYPNATAYIRGRYKTQEKMLRPLGMFASASPSLTAGLKLDTLLTTFGMDKLSVTPL